MYAIVAHRTRFFKPTNQKPIFVSLDSFVSFVLRGVCRECVDVKAGDLEGNVCVRCPISGDLVINDWNIAIRVNHIQVDF